MIKPTHAPQLSAVKSRTGLQSISDLIPRLIRQYELQAELVNRRTEPSRLPLVSVESNHAHQQATFSWFDANR